MRYEVTIKAIVTKSYIVEADDIDEAIAIGHENFSVLNDGSDERYEQELLGICALNEENEQVETGGLSWV
jgi:hypothetical protein